MGFIKRVIWPIITGVFGIIIFFIVMNVSYELLVRIAGVPIISSLLFLNARILGVDVVSLESFTAGSIATMLFMALCTSYDSCDKYGCYKKASRTCGVLYCIAFSFAGYILFSELGFSLSAITNSIPYIVFGILLLSGSKFE